MRVPGGKNHGDSENRQFELIRGEELDAHALRVLDFSVIVEKLLELSQTIYGREMSERLAPMTKLEDIQRGQQETTESREWLDKFDDFSWGPEGSDLRPLIAKGRVGSSLVPEELLQIRSFLGLLRQIKQRMTEARSFPILSGLAKEFHPLTALEKEIEKSISAEGEILDGASYDLLRLRKQSRLIEGRLREKLQDLIDSPSVRKFLQDPIITVRDQRYVIPLKTEYKSQVPGVVHDRSASGQTVFIEPLATVNINNELREIQLKIKQEEDRILATLSGAVGEQAGEILRSIQSLARLDFIFAKARLSEIERAAAPKVDEGSFIQLVAARHPLLDGNPVPIDIEVGRGFRTLVITGPNTGGKTVSLKTAGLLVLMAQAGLHIPASSQSCIGLFQNIFADVGDEQSLQQSLSTFSSHMSQIVRILRETDAHSLVLLDELGAGTDPREGAALATAILESLHDRSVRVIASTHHTELISFAYFHPEARNASMEFNLESLSPTFRMKLGIPGSSHAFLIAKRLGLKAEVLAEAQKFLTVEREKLDELIGRLEQERQKLESDREAAEKAKEEALRIRDEYSRQSEDLKKRKKEVLRGAYAEAQKVIKDSRSQMEELLQKLRQEKPTSGKTEEIRKEIEQARNEVENRIDIAEKRGLPVNLSHLKPGDEVWIPRFKAQGVVMEIKLEEGKARVQIGTMRANLHEEEIERLEAPGERLKIQAEIPSRPQVAAGKDVSWKLDLHGEKVEAALSVLDKYLDNAVLANFPFVYVLHGRGTGALRQAIHSFLRKHPSVLRFRMGEGSEGGQGVTIVYLK